MPAVIRRLSLCLLVIVAVWAEPVDAAMPAAAGEKRDKRSDDLAPLQTVVDSLVQEVGSLKAQLAAQQTKLNSYGQMVAFHAWCNSAPVSTVARGTVIVPHVATNIGNAYDPQTGFFTAPVSGLYMFHATFMDHDLNDQIHAGIYVGGTQVAQSTSDSRHGYWDNPAIAAIVHVTAGQKVDLRSLNGGTDNFYGQQYTTFSGFLIRAD